MGTKDKEILLRIRKAMQAQTKEFQNGDVAHSYKNVL